MFIATACWEYFLFLKQRLLPAKLLWAAIARIVPESKRSGYCQDKLLRVAVTTATLNSATSVIYTQNRNEDLVEYRKK